MGKQAFQLLIHNLDNADAAKQRVVIRPELTVRQSTGPVRS
jgi:LacI family transcriptional regulator